MVLINYENVVKLKSIEIKKLEHINQQILI